MKEYSEMDKYYQVLGLKPGASEKEIVEAYKVLVKVWNPDRFSDDPNIQKIATEKIKEIDEAFKQVLVWAGSLLEKEREIPEPQLEVRTERPETSGSIIIQTEPDDAVIVINEQPVGMGSYGRIDLPIGSYKVRVIKEGYEIWEQEIEIKVGGKEGVVAKLKLKEPESGEVWKDAYLGMEFVYVKGGVFQMGDIFGDGNRDEKPVHEVRLDAFWIGKYLVTQQQWERVVGNNPSRFKNGGDYPVEQVNWYDVEKFISRLNQETGMDFRLPTEAEWEYAARSGGKKEKWAGTSDESELTEYAWYNENSGDKTHRVGRKKANGLGVYDMSGNVCEWVQDWYDKDYYRNSPTDNPQCKQLGYERHKVIRGGVWHSGPMPLRTISRAGIDPREFAGVGFRLVLPAQAERPLKKEKEQPITSGETYSTPQSRATHLMEAEAQIASDRKKYDSPPAFEIEKKKKSGSFLRWLLWWRLDPTELDRQIAGYQSLKITQSARGQSLLFLILSASITTIFILLFDWDSAYFVEVSIALLLGYFIYRGQQWAMIGTMILWSFEKFYLWYEGLISGSSSYWLHVFWWAIYMHAFYLAFKVERLRTQKKKS